MPDCVSTVCYESSDEGISDHSQLISKLLCNGFISISPRYVAVCRNEPTSSLAVTPTMSLSTENQPEQDRSYTRYDHVQYAFQAVDGVPGDRKQWRDKSPAICGNYRIQPIRSS